VTPRGCPHRAAAARVTAVMYCPGIGARRRAEAPVADDASCNTVTTTVRVEDAG